MLQAAALAVRQFPLVNASLSEDQVWVGRAGGGVGVGG